MPTRGSTAVEGDLQRADTWVDSRLATNNEIERYEMTSARGLDVDGDLTSARGLDVKGDLQRADTWVDSH